MKTLFSLLVFVFACTYIYAQDGAAAPAAETAAGLYNDGLEALKSKDYAKGYDLMLKSIEIADPEEDKDVLKLAKVNGARAAYYAATADAKGGDHEAAVAKFEKGLELNPEAHTCAYGLGKAYYDKKMYPEAVDGYLKAAEIAKAAGDESKVESYAKRVGVAVSKLYTSKDYENAVASGQKYLDAGFDADNVRYYMAQSLSKSGKASDAIEHAAKAVELGTDDAEGKYVYTYAQILEKAGKKAEAKVQYLRVPPGKYYENAQYKGKE